MGEFGQKAFYFDVILECEFTPLDSTTIVAGCPEGIRGFLTYSLREAILNVSLRYCSAKKLYILFHKKGWSDLSADISAKVYC